MQVQALRDEQTRTAQLHTQFLAAINKKNEDLEDWLMNLRARHGQGGTSASHSLGPRRGITPDACNRHAIFGQDDSYAPTVVGSHVPIAHTEVLHGASSDQAIHPGTPGLASSAIASAATHLMDHFHGHGQTVGSANNSSNNSTAAPDGTDTMRTAHSSSSTGELPAAEGSSGSTAVTAGLSSSESVSTYHGPQELHSNSESFGTSANGRPRHYQGMIVGQEEPMAANTQNSGATYDSHLPPNALQVPLVAIPQVPLPQLPQLPIAGGMRTSMPRTSLRGRVSSSSMFAKEPTPVRRTLGGDQPRMSVSPNTQQVSHNNNSGGLSSPRGATSYMPGNTSPRRTQTTQGLARSLFAGRGSRRALPRHAQPKALPDSSPQCRHRQHPHSYHDPWPPQLPAVESSPAHQRNERTERMAKWALSCGRRSLPCRPLRLCSSSSSSAWRQRRQQGQWRAAWPGAHHQ